MSNDWRQKVGPVISNLINLLNDEGFTVTYADGPGEDNFAYIEFHTDAAEDMEELSIFLTSQNIADFEIGGTIYVHRIIQRKMWLEIFDSNYLQVESKWAEK